MFACVATAIERSRMQYGMLADVGAPAKRQREDLGVADVRLGARITFCPSRDRIYARGFSSGEPFGEVSLSRLDRRENVK